MDNSTLSLSVPESTKAEPQVAAFFEHRTCSIQYIVSDPNTGACAVIDPVLDYDEKAGAIVTKSADVLLQYIYEQNLRVAWILDTHPHADHLSAATYLRKKTGALTGIGEHVVEVQKLWRTIYNLPSTFPTDGSQWDRLFADGDHFAIGDIEAKALFSPGHTPASVTYIVGNAAFVHDTLLMPDFGTARCDFPGGDARQLWQTLQRILALPEDTRLFTGHDYRPGGRAPVWESTVAKQKTSNVHLQEAQSEPAFIELRKARDAKLPMPKLMLHALQVNIAAGQLPAPEDNGQRYLKIPLGAFSKACWD